MIASLFETSRDGEGMKVVFWALLLAIVWTVTLGVVAHSHALHSPAGMWTGVFGLPGVVVASWVRPFLGADLTIAPNTPLCFVVNWIFYCTVVQGVLSVKRSFLK